MAELVCWNCGKEAGGGHFCSSCVKRQPLGPGSDYFTFFELPKKLRLDAKDLESRFYSLSRRKSLCQNVDLLSRFLPAFVRRRLRRGVESR